MDNIFTRLAPCGTSEFYCNGKHHCPECGSHPTGGYMYCQNGKCEQAARSRLPKVVKARFTPEYSSVRVNEVMRIHVAGEMSDESLKMLFSFYPDEITFAEEEIVGLTEQGARDLFTERDIAYLRS